MLVTETVFHLGSELERAVNRMDFFRLFKSLAGSYGFEYFGLAEITGDSEGIDFKHEHALHNFSNAWFGETPDMIIGKDDPTARYFQLSSVACCLEIDSNASSVFGSSGSSYALVVPLHAATGKRYGLVMLGRDSKVEHQLIALIAHEAAIIFQRYFEVILSLESISGLSDREIQIVRWTSEGKTSAEIAIILGLSEHTVNSYIAAVLRKLHVVNRAQMVASALRSGLIT